MVVLEQPVTLSLAVVYKIFTVPLLIPVTTPVALFTVAILLSAELHDPPAVKFESVVVLPIHAAAIPVIEATAGKDLTVICTVLEHPVLLVYIIVVVPALTPVTTPFASTVAID